MAPKLPPIPRLADGRGNEGRNAIFGSVNAIRIALTRVVQDEIDFRETEPRDLHVEIKIDERLQFDREDFLVPSGIQRELVVSDDICPSFFCAEMCKRDRGHGLHAEQLRGFNTTVARDDFTIFRDQDGVREPEPFNTRGNLFDLLAAMFARVTGIGSEL